MDRTGVHGDGMEPSKVIADLSGAEVEVLPQIEDLPEDLRLGCLRRSMRRPRPIA